MVRRWEDPDVLMQGEQAVQVAMELLQMPATLCAAPLEVDLHSWQIFNINPCQSQASLMDFRGIQQTPGAEASRS